MKINELDNCLKGKLRLNDFPATRHTDYRLRLSGEIIGLPVLLRVSRGSGEISNSNIDGIAKGLGLNESTLKETVSCHVGRPCILLCLSAKLVEFVHRKAEEQGEVFRPGMLAMLQSIELILADPDLMQTSQWNKRELKALQRCQLILEQLSNHKDLGIVVQKLIKCIALS